jgi:GNAT superfamily N-acetyltransferase
VSDTLDAGKFVWRRIRPADLARVEVFLRLREPCCVTACSRYLKRIEAGERHLGWVLRQKGLLGRSSPPEALILYHKRMLFPILGEALKHAGGLSLPPPGFLDDYMRRVGVYGVQGLKEDSLYIEGLLAMKGHRPLVSIDYDLMFRAPLHAGWNTAGIPLPQPLPQGEGSALNAYEEAGALAPLGGGLRLREGGKEDMDALFPLQAAYEQEEVILPGEALKPAVCRLNLKQIMEEERLLAVFDGEKAVGKINTNAESYSCTQMGGVYVLPSYRRHGIALQLTATLAGRLAAEGRGVSLFVKKRNEAARRVYLKAGLRPIADYRISYY